MPGLWLCETCGKKWANYGLTDAGSKRRWCAGCANEQLAAAAFQVLVQLLLRRPVPLDRLFGVVRPEGLQAVPAVLRLAVVVVALHPGEARF